MNLCFNIIKWCRRVDSIIRGEGVAEVRPTNLAIFKALSLAPPAASVGAAGSRAALLRNGGSLARIPARGRRRPVDRGLLP